MKKDQIYLVLGVLVLILPITGFSRDSKNLLIYICGVLIVLLTLASMYFKSKYSRPKIKSDIFEESSPEKVLEKEEVDNQSFI